MKFSIGYNHIEKPPKYTPISLYNCVDELEEEVVFHTQVQTVVSPNFVPLKLASQEKVRNWYQTIDASQGFKLISFTELSGQNSVVDHSPS